MSGLRSCAGLVGRVLAGLAAVAFIVLLPITLLAHNLAVVIFDPQTLTETISGRLIDSGLMRQTMVDNLLGGDASLGGVSLQSATQFLSPADREEMIELLLPEGWVREQLLQVTTEFFAWFDSPSTRLVLTVDTGPVAARLEGEAAASVVEMVVESWPACTLEDVGQMIGIGATPGEEGFPYCEPPEPLRGVVVATVSGGLRLLGGSLPVRLAIVDQTFEDTDRLMQTKEQVRLLMFLGRWGILASLSLLGVIMALAVRSWRGLARWWGIPLLLGGMIGLVPVLLGGAFLRTLVAQLTAGLSAVPALVDMAQALGGAIASAVLGRQVLHAGLASGLGILLLLLSLLRRGPARQLPSGTSGAVAPASTAPPLIERAAPEAPEDRPPGMFG